MRILVTGGAGYIGSHFINKALAEQPEWSFVVVDNFGQGKENVLEDARVLYRDLDLLDREKLSKVFVEAKFDLVVHFAALANVPDSVTRPDKYYFNNIVGGLNLLDVMREVNVNRIIFSSSSSVYGENKLAKIPESAEKNPSNAYGRSKLMFEQILSDYQRAYGIQSVSFRYLLAAGSDSSGKIGEWHTPESHALPMVLYTLLGKRKKFFVFGNDFPTPDGTGVRDYVHVNDIAQAHLLVIEAMMSGRNLAPAYNIGIDKGFSVLDLVRAAEKVSGKTVPYEFAPRRPGDPSTLIADASALRRDVGWAPQYTSLEQIVGSTYTYLSRKFSSSKPQK